MSELVTITAERLKALEAIEAKVKAQQAQDLKRLAAYDKAHPDKVLERVKRYQNKDRDAYNARRRELRRLAKAAAAAAPGGGDTASA
jgi:hypothetical protein